MNMTMIINIMTMAMITTIMTMTMVIIVMIIELNHHEYLDHHSDRQL